MIDCNCLSCSNLLKKLSIKDRLALHLKNQPNNEDTNSNKLSTETTYLLKILQEEEDINLVYNCIKIKDKETVVTIEDKKLFIKEYISQNIKQLHNSCDNDITFNLKVEESSIANAGKGVILNGKARSGSVLAMYPGIILSEEDILYLLREDSYLNYFKTNQYMLQRYDNYRLDANLEGFLVKSTLLKQNKDPQFLLQNNFAIGHYINHPTYPNAPNVVFYPYNFNKDDNGNKKCCFYEINLKYRNYSTFIICK